MKNINVIDQKLNLEEIFTNEEIKSLKKTFPKINILIRASPITTNANSDLSKISSTKTKSSQIENSKDKIFVYKKYYYKLILDDTRNKYEQEGNNIMVKSLSCLIDDLFYEDNIYKNMHKNNSNSIFIYNDDKQKNEKLFLHNKKQTPISNYPEKKLNEKSTEILPTNYDMDKDSKTNKEEKIINSKNNFDYIKRIKSPNNNYKNIYYYNIINSKKIINNNNFKNEDKLKNKKFTLKSLHPTKSMNVSMNYNNINKLNNPISYANHRHMQSNNYNNYISSIKIYNQTEQNKNNQIFLKKNNFNQTMTSSLIEGYNNLNYLDLEKKKKESYKKYTGKKLSKKIKSVKYLVKHISTKKNDSKTPTQTRNSNIRSDSSNIESLFKNKNNKYSFMNVDTTLFNNIENQNFNIFELTKNVGRENILPVIGNYIFNRLGFYNLLKYNKYENWCRKIAEGYIKTNPYHTDLHAADITHTCLIYLKVGKVNKISKLSKNSKCALFLSCMCHDYKHPGVNNNYLKETKNKIAIKYNDISILENMHIAQAFKLINNSNNEYNIFESLDNNLYKQIRKEMISCVLSTDMTFHKDFLNFLKKCIEKNKNQNTNSESNNTENNNNKTSDEDYQQYMNVLIHSSDISNPTKPFDIYFKWADLVVKEFYEQGDKEKKLNMPCSCDRNKVTIYQSQLGFINYIEIPYFSLFVEVFVNLRFYIDNLNNNKQALLKMQENENKEKEKQDGKK